MSLGLNSGMERNRRSETFVEGIAGNYFPLAPGNQWIYSFNARDGVRRQIVRVEANQEIRGQHWSLVTYRVDGTDEEFTRLLRTEGDLLMQYSVPRTEQIHLIDFGRSEADRTDPALGFVEERDRSVEINGVSFERCLLVRSGSVDHEVGIYAPGIGLIESSWLYGRKQLSEATIDGTTIRP